MDIIILGVLMMRHSTIYEIRQFVENNLSTVSSNSMGSIQAGIKKLLKHEWITYEEQQEKGVTKKVYRITDAGKQQFEASVSKPMLYKEKNMELVKFFFLGFMDKETQRQSIENYIAELKKELGLLDHINQLLEPRYAFDETYLEELRKHSGASEKLTEENVQTIACFQYATLDFGRDKLKFEINWFKELKKTLEMENEQHEETR